MAIRLPQGLPAEGTLRGEGIEVAVSGPRQGQNFRPLTIALLNLMPQKAITETQLARLLGASPFEVELTLFVPDGYVSKNTPADHMQAFYQPWSEIRERRFDGLIVTGAPVEMLPFEEVRYWDQLTKIFEWSYDHAYARYLICWAAQAALYHFHGVPKHQLDAKMFGVFPHRVVQNDTGLLRGFDREFVTPVSRHTEVRGDDLPSGADLNIVAESDESGLCMIDEPSRRTTYMFNHLEYDTETLREEYLRDVEAGRPIALPRHYFPDDDPAMPPSNAWRPYAHLLFPNWLNRLHRGALALAADAEMMQWMLAEPRHPDKTEGRHSDFLVYADQSPETTPGLLHRLAALDLSPHAMKVHAFDGASTMIEVRLERCSETAAERISHALLNVAEVRKVTHRNDDGTGGIFVDPAKGTNVCQPRHKLH